MARHRRVRSPIGILSLWIFALLIILPIGALVLWSADQNAAARINYSVSKVLWFSFWQAAVSTLVSLILGLLIAWIIAHSTQWMSRLIKLSLVAPLAMPVVTICLSWNFLLGSQGLSGWLGIQRSYGIFAILSVHIFLNMALIAWLVLPAWKKAPHGYWRNAQMLDIVGWQLWRQLEWPIIKPYAYRATALSFLFCFTSFTPVFLLGGSPKYTTFETAIYAAMRTNFDPVYALILGAIQLVICSAIIFTILRRLPDQPFQMGDEANQTRLIRAHPIITTLPGILIIMVCLAPLASIIYNAYHAISALRLGELGRSSSASAGHILPATASTLLIIILAMISSLLLGWAIAAYKVHLDSQQSTRVARLLEMISGAIYALPALIIGAGWLALISLLGLWKSDWISYVAFVSITMLIGIPVVIRAIMPAYEQLATEYGKLTVMLNMTGWHKTRLIVWPRLKPLLLLSAAYAGVMAAGDLGAFILVSRDNIQTLPVLIQRQMASYDHTVAAISALALVATQAAWLLLVAALSRRQSWQRK